MNNQVFKAMLQTLKIYHSHLDIKRDNVKIEIWTERGFQFFTISWLEMKYLTLYRNYTYDDISNDFMLTCEECYESVLSLLDEI